LNEETVGQNKQRILIVDDEPGICAICKTVLTRNGYDVVVTNSAADGLAAFEEDRDGVDLFLVDVTMPGIDGIEMIHRIVRVHPHANIILMTGYSPESLLPEDMEKLCALLAKPFTPAQLIEAITRCLPKNSLSAPRIAPPGPVL
jgi:two-component system cell cycle sensor histidine kinase/response regulator CckA